MANFFSNTSDLQNILDVLQSKALPTIHTSVCEAFPTAVDQVIQPPEGFYYSQVNLAGDSNLIADNIKSGVTIFGVEGALTGGSEFETFPDFTYTVNDVSGADYGFVLNDEGYYESTNQGVDSSFSICRVNFVVTRQCNIVFETYSYGESNYDYGIMSKLDTALELSNYADTSTKVQQNFYGLSSNLPLQIVYENVSVGSHFIDIKYLKDLSASSYDDSFKFKIMESSSLDQSILDGLVAADEDLKPENIRKGVNILGVNGTYGAATADMDAIFNRTISGSYTNTDLTVIPKGAFAFCDQLSAVTFARASSVSDYGVYYCQGLKTASFPQCTYVGDYAFAECFNLSSVAFPNCSSVGYMAFMDCGLKNPSFPTLRYIDGYAFYYNTAMSRVSMWQVYSIGNSAFAYCSSLGMASFQWCRSIASGAFMRCRMLSQLYLKSSSMCTLANSNAFSSTPFMGYSTYFSGTPYIYVPSSLVASYQAASNWSYFSSYFSGV